MEENRKELWPGWRTVRLIGHGSFGEVFEIEQELFNKTEKAAVKHISIPQHPSDIAEMRSDGYDDESIGASFRGHLKSIVEEYQFIHSLNGTPNVVSCDDVRYTQKSDGIGWDIYMKMELLTPVSRVLPEIIPEEMTIKLAKDLCNALVRCRQLDIIHRDIKPQNIFISKFSDYKLGDFGITKTVEKTMGGTKTGTFKYMAPEVFNNQPYGHSADVYSLGLVLYWMLNRKRIPFVPLPPQKLLYGMEEEAKNRRLSGEPIPAPIDDSPALKEIVLKVCAYDPNERYRSAAEMPEKLEQLKPVPAEPERTQREEPADERAASLIKMSKGRKQEKKAEAMLFAPMDPENVPEERERPLGWESSDAEAREVCAQDKTISVYGKSVKAPVEDPQSWFFRPQSFEDDGIIGSSEKHDDRPSLQEAAAEQPEEQKSRDDGLRRMKFFRLGRKRQWFRIPFRLRTQRHRMPEPRRRMMTKERKKAGDRCCGCGSGCAGDHPDLHHKIIGLCSAERRPYIQ